MNHLNKITSVPRINHPGFPEGLSKLVLGGLAFGWYLSRQQSFEILDAYWEAGGNLIDTSDNYSNWAPGHTGGESETLIGKWLRDRKANLHMRIATKVGYETKIGSGLSRNHILQSARASLRRLGIDRIDLYQLNFQRIETSLEETLTALKELQDCGDIYAVGFCNIHSEMMRSCLHTAEKIGLWIAAYQGKLNYLERERIREKILENIQKNKLLLMVYGIMARGFLSGKYDRVFNPAVSFRAQSVYRKYYHIQYQDTLQQFFRYASSIQKSPAQAAYHWVIAELERQIQNNFLIIGGFTNTSQMQLGIEQLG